MYKKILKIMLIFFLLFIFIFSSTIVINSYVVKSQENKAYISENISNIKEVDYIMILGCGIWGNNPSPMLKDRLLESVKVANQFKDAYIIVSGDNGGEHYNEVKVMRNFLIEEGIAENRILDDNIGFSTYESVYNLKYNFKAKNPIIVTQDFHIHRALYIAETMNLYAAGVIATSNYYVSEPYYFIRDFFARNKDFIKCLFDGI